MPVLAEIYCKTAVGRMRHLNQHHTRELVDAQAMSVVDTAVEIFELSARLNVVVNLNVHFPGVDASGKLCAVAVLKRPGPSCLSTEQKGFRASRLT